MQTPDFLATPAPPASRRGFNKWSVIILAGLIMTVLIFAVQLSRQNEIQPQQGQVAPDFRVADFEGNAIQLSDLEGEIVIINFWASWCAPCRSEAPDLQAIYEDYRDQGVMIIGINWLDNERNARAFMAEFGLTYLNAPDIGERVGNQYNIQGAPENFIIGRDGVVVRHFIGAVDYPVLANELDALIEQSTEN